MYINSIIRFSRPTKEGDLITLILNKMLFYTHIDMITNKRYIVIL